MTYAQHSTITDIFQLQRDLGRLSDAKWSTITYIRRLTQSALKSLHIKQHIQSHVGSLGMPFLPPEQHTQCLPLTEQQWRDFWDVIAYFRQKEVLHPGMIEHALGFEPTAMLQKWLTVSDVYTDHETRYNLNVMVHDTITAIELALHAAFVPPDRFEK